MAVSWSPRGLRRYSTCRPWRARVTICLLGGLLSASVLALGALGGTPGLAALTIGTLLLDVAMQSGMVANQARVYALRPDARSRLNTAYMTCAYLGGSAGSWLGVRAWGRAGWWGVCALVALLTVLALVRHPARPAPAPEEPAGSGSGPMPEPGRYSPGPSSRNAVSSSFVVRMA